MDGLAATRKIREHERKSYLAAAEAAAIQPSTHPTSRSSTHLPVFAVTAGVGEAQQKECLSSGRTLCTISQPLTAVSTDRLHLFVTVDLCLTKPVSLRDLELVLAGVPHRAQRLSTFL
jgi:CheY-like chemotaxis protein